MRKQQKPTRKTTVFTLRLEPKLRFALDLLARKRKRSMTSVIEWALYQAIDDHKNGLFEESATGEAPQNILEKVWDTDDSDRFIKIAMNYPQFLNFDEERLWKAIQENDALIRLGKPNYREIRTRWEQLKAEFNIKE